MRVQRIRTKPQTTKPGFRLGGWLGPGAAGTYLWFGMNGKFVGILDGAPLYRLAKAIVKRFEEGR